MIQTIKFQIQNCPSSYALWCLDCEIQNNYVFLLPTLPIWICSLSLDPTVAEPYSLYPKLKLKFDIQFMNYFFYVLINCQFTNFHNLQMKCFCGGKCLKFSNDNKLTNHPTQVGHNLLTFTCLVGFRPLAAIQVEPIVLILIIS